ncbi:MAG: hypothetical protein ABSC06_02355 [Rhodopila sp.]
MRLAVDERRKTIQRRCPGFADLSGRAFPRPIQQEAILPTANCVVLKGQKTEAALWRFQHRFAAGAVVGSYFALPTRVAASQMFTRMKQFRDALFPPADRPTVVLAVPRSEPTMRKGTYLRFPPPRGDGPR